MSLLTNSLPVASSRSLVLPSLRWHLCILFCSLIKSSDLPPHSSPHSAPAVLSAHPFAVCLSTSPEWFSGPSSSEGINGALSTALFHVCISCLATASSHPSLLSLTTSVATLPHLCHCIPSYLCPHHSHLPFFFSLQPSFEFLQFPFDVWMLKHWTDHNIYLPACRLWVYMDIYTAVYGHMYFAINICKNMCPCTIYIYIYNLSPSGACTYDPVV